MQCCVPELTSEMLSRHILDIGSGSSGLCGLAALAVCAGYVFLCPDAAYERILRENLQLNSSRVICERLRLTSMPQLCSKLCASSSSVFDCLVLRIQDGAKDWLPLARRLLKPAGLLIVLVQGQSAQPMDLHGLETLMAGERVVCMNLT